MTREEWKELVIEWLASGQSCSDYCASRGIKHTLLGWWKWRLTKDGESLERPLPVPFVELEMTRVASRQRPNERIELEVGRIHVSVPDDFMADTLARVLDVLEAR